MRRRVRRRRMRRVKRGRSVLDRQQRHRVRGQDVPRRDQAEDGVRPVAEPALAAVRVSLGHRLMARTMDREALGYLVWEHPMF